MVATVISVIINHLLRSIPGMIGVVRLIVVVIVIVAVTVIRIAIFTFKYIFLRGDPTSHCNHVGIVEDNDVDNEHDEYQNDTSSIRILRLALILLIRIPARIMIRLLLLLLVV